MKVTTDACLLGSITPVEKVGNVLDIGAGTGLLSLMVAQRCDADILAVELDTAASEQATRNFLQSPWSERLQVINSAIQTIVQSSITTFERIICNPPFFENCLLAREQKRAQARHTDTLSFRSLAHAIATLLSQDGQAWVMLPVNFSGVFNQQVLEHGLFLTQTIDVRSSSERQPHRHILVIEHTEKPLIKKMIALYDKHPTYSAAFTELMKPYYLFLS